MPTLEHRNLSVSLIEDKRLRKEEFHRRVNVAMKFGAQLFDERQVKQYDGIELSKRVSNFIRQKELFGYEDEILFGYNMRADEVREERTRMLKAKQ